MYWTMLIQYQVQRKQRLGRLKQASFFSMDSVAWIKHADVTVQRCSNVGVTKLIRFRSLQEQLETVLPVVVVVVVVVVAAFHHHHHHHHLLLLLAVQFAQPETTTVGHPLWLRKFNDRA